MIDYYYTNKTIYLLLGCLLFMSSCVSTNSNKIQDQTLYSTYKEYSTLLSGKDEYSREVAEKIFSFLSPRYQTEILNSRAKTHALLNQLVRDYLAFPLLMSKEITHYQQINGSTACLVVNGMTKENEKIALYLTFKKQKNWLIDYIRIEYLANYNQFISEAACDSKKIETFRLREMMMQ